MVAEHDHARSQSITVSVSNVTDPSDSDAIAFLVPYSADRSVTAPQKFQWCLKGSSGADYLTTGSTSLTCAFSHPPRPPADPAPDPTPVVHDITPTLAECHLPREPRA